jgi:hypothetical protein
MPRTTTGNSNVCRWNGKTHQHCHLHSLRLTRRLGSDAVGRTLSNDALNNDIRFYDNDNNNKCANIPRCQDGKRDGFGSGGPLDLWNVHTSMDQFLTALRGPQQQQASVEDTLNKLADRCQQSTQLADRRAAVLALRGLSRDYKHQVGTIALSALLTVLEHDAAVDEEIAKAVLQTINILCEVDVEIANKTEREVALAHTDFVLANPAYTQKLLALIQDDASYVRLAAIHLLNTLLSNRRAAVQAQFVNAPESSRTVIALLEEKRDIIRTGQTHSRYVSTRALTRPRGLTIIPVVDNAKHGHPVDFRLWRFFRNTPSNHRARRRGGRRDHSI